jgi:molybdopterin-guanine dinucleotide biosynthesis protein MobB
MKPIVSIVGRTNSGKTTLIEKLIPELKKRGYKVGVIKHTKHQFEIDHPGKDTWRMTKAGADTVVIVSDKKLAMIRTTNYQTLISSLNVPCFSFDEISAIVDFIINKYGSRNL